eukprot:3222120-Pleurochrysis_carterae.AAC.1
MPNAPTTDFQQAQVPSPPNPDTTLPIAEFPQNPAPKSWYVIIGGSFEGSVLKTTIAKFVRASKGMQIAVPTDPAQASLTKQRRQGAYAKYATNGCAMHANPSKRRR